MSTRTAPMIPPGTWTIDPVHSSVEFTVKHMGIANVRGKFTEFEGVLDVAEDLAESRVHGAVHVASIDTNEEQRDAHLRSPDFFDAESHPKIEYELTRVEPIDDESSCVFGNLTMHGVTREVKLQVVLHGTDTDPSGTERAGLEAIGTLLRSEFDMKFNQALGSGNMLVGDKVKVSLEISAIKQAA